MTPFHRLVNDFSRLLAAPHVAADGSLVLSAGSGALLGTLGVGQVYRVTAADPSTFAVLGIFEATGLTADTLTGVTAVEGFTDANLPTGTVVDLRATAKTFSELQGALPRSLFDDAADAANVTTTKTALYDHVVAAGTLGSDGDKLVAEFVGVTAANGNNKTVSVNFGGVEVLNTGALTVNNKNWLVRVTVWRKSNTTARALAEFASDGVAAKVTYTPEGTLTGFDFAATGAHLILYGQSGTASGDITATAGRVWKAAAA